MTENEPQRFESDALADAPYPNPDRVVKRVTRAMTAIMRVERDGPGIYHVDSGSGDSYTVELESGMCDCPDAQSRGPWCKHFFAVLFQTGELPSVVGTGIVADESASADADHAEDDEQATEDGDDTDTLTERVEHFEQNNPGASAIEAISQLGIDPDDKERVEEVLA